MIQPLLVFSDWALLILRLVLGAIMLVHSLLEIKKLKANNQISTNQTSKSKKLRATINSLAKLIGGMALIVGFLTQIVAVLFLIQFLVIIFKTAFKKEPLSHYEYPLLIVAISLILATMGGGVYNLDSYLNLFIF